MTATSRVDVTSGKAPFSAVHRASFSILSHQPYSTGCYRGPPRLNIGIVERTIAWLNRCRRLAKDWENLNRSALAFLKLASIRLMLRKLCNP